MLHLPALVLIAAHVQVVAGLLLEHFLNGSIQVDEVVVSTVL